MMLMLPSNYAPWLWGWPNRFLQRMQQVNTVVFIVGANNGESFSRGIDTIEQLERLPKDYSGGIWTNRADLLGPVIRAR